MLLGSREAGEKTPSLEDFLPLTWASHILQELTVSSYVPNNTLLKGGCEVPVDPATSSSQEAPPSMLLLTGPNYSGKSVYMKQVSGNLAKDLNHWNNCYPGGPYCLPSTDWEVRQVHFCLASVESN